MSNGKDQTDPRVTCRLRGKYCATDWLSGLTFAGDTEIVQVVFKNTRSAFFRNPDRIPVKTGDWVAVEAAPGTDIGKVSMTGPLVRLQMKKANARREEMKKLLRIATDSDMDKFRVAKDREEQTMIRSRQIAADLGLDMKIGDVEYQGDGMKAIFYYIADERVDFRKLIRLLADAFKVRIEMKQIGARQEAGRIGGIGPCGRALCCSSWMSRFVSVGTGSARVQDLSMNPQKLAGQCGKLKCCINFETDVYAEASKKLPHKDTVLYTQDQEYYWFKVDILAGKITYSTDKKLAVNTVVIDTARAFEIIALNKQGIKPEKLMPDADESLVEKEYVEIVGQDSLTRFDKTRKKKRRQGKADNKSDNRNEQKSSRKDERSEQKVEQRSKAGARQKADRRQDHKPEKRADKKPEQTRPQHNNNENGGNGNGGNGNGNGNSNGNGNGNGNGEKNRDRRKNNQQRRASNRKPDNRPQADDNREKKAPPTEDRPVRRADL